MSQNRVAIIDEKEEDLRLACLALEAAGRSVLAISSYSKIKVLEKIKPDVIVLGCDNLVKVVDLSRQLHEIGCKTVVLVTRHDVSELDSLRKRARLAMILKRQRDMTQLVSEVGYWIDSAESDPAGTPSRLVIAAPYGPDLVPEAQKVLEENGLDLRGIFRKNDLFDVLRFESPALVILGDDLPEATIEEICISIRSDPRLRPVSILTILAHGKRRRAEAIFEAGSNDVLVRPVTATEFDRAVSRLVTTSFRRHVRVPVRIKVHVPDSGKVQRAIGYSINLASGGLLLEIESDLYVGSQIDLRFRLPESQVAIETRAEVVRNEGNNRYGLQFVDLDERDSKILLSYTRKNDG